MANQFRFRACPCCGSKKSKPVISTDIKAESVDFDSLVQYWNGFFKDKSIFSYHRCDECGLLFAPCFFYEEQLATLYAQMPPNMDEVPLSALKATQKGYFKSLHGASELTGGYLEVGPDVGLFTEMAVKDGNFKKFWLFEPNRAVAEKLASVVEGKEYRIIHDMFGFNEVPLDECSTAVMVHVLDHLLDPVAALTSLRERMSSNSTLLIVTHDESSILSKLLGWRWPAYCLQHPQIYNPKTIKRVLENAGFENISVKKTVNYFPLGFLVKHLSWALGFKFKNLPNFGNWVVGLPLGNIITIAKKV